MSVEVFIGGLHPKTPVQEVDNQLQLLLGPELNYTIRTQTLLDGKNFLFIKTYSLEDAYHAIESLDNQMLAGGKLTVDFSRFQQERFFQSWGGTPPRGSEWWDKTAPPSRTQRNHDNNRSDYHLDEPNPHQHENQASHYQPSNVDRAKSFKDTNGQTGYRKRAYCYHDDNEHRLEEHAHQPKARDSSSARFSINIANTPTVPQQEEPAAQHHHFLHPVVHTNAHRFVGADGSLWKTLQIAGHEYYPLRALSFGPHTFTCHSTSGSVLVFCTSCGTIANTEGLPSTCRACPLHPKEPREVNREA